MGKLYPILVMSYVCIIIILKGKVSQLQQIIKLQKTCGQIQLTFYDPSNARVSY